MLLKDVAFNDPTASNLNPKPDSPLPALNKKASASADEAVQNLVRNDGLRALLIYRAVVFGAFCSTAADSSSISGTELGRRIVYFI
jgi:hypothetical protein